ncbi:hypothetical protein LshimejAT787_0310850 [Lyophyllum shimeji]|uniref:Uncharacterized protein n=1 Tax=Lyophyllum shimeji TaxID=47721 RepID=A0A9P3PJV2_LYOSH|nr:hypothetical protein LshimejAT787_0310850 [Lyophyllum shimeji]
MPATDNIERRKRTPDFSVLLGTYHWVWNGHPSVDAQITPEDPSSDDGGTLTLSLKPRTRVAKPANVIGEFALPRPPGHSGSFAGLTPRRGKRGAGTLDIKGVAWEGAPAPPMPERGHALWVSEAVDDNGHPFVGMHVTDNTTFWDVLGKRQADGYVPGQGMTWEGLTESEIERLGLLGEEDAEGLTEEVEGVGEDVERAGDEAAGDEAAGARVGAGGPSEQAARNAAEAQAEAAATASAAADAVLSAASAEARRPLGGAVPVGVSELPVLEPPDLMPAAPFHRTLDTVPTTGEVAAPTTAGAPLTGPAEPVADRPHLTEPAVDDLLDGVATAEDVATPATVLPKPLRAGQVPPDVSELPVTAPTELPAVAIDEPLDTTVASVNARDAPSAAFVPPVQETAAPETPLDPRETGIIREEARAITAAVPKSLPAEGVEDRETPRIIREEKEAEAQAPISAERTAEEKATRLTEEIRQDGRAVEGGEVEREAEPVPLVVTDVVREKTVLEALTDEDTEKTVPSKRKAADTEVVEPEDELEQKRLRVE